MKTKKEVQPKETIESVNKKLSELQKLYSEKANQNVRLYNEISSLKNSFNMVKANFEREKSRVDGLIKALNK